MDRSAYIDSLKYIGSLSRLFSESEKPYLYYRIAEHLYIKAFKAQDVTRSDIAIDAILNNVGVGLKTFQGHNGKSSYQKIAEFNKLRTSLEATLRERGSYDFIKEVATFRNDRIEFVTDTFGVEDFVYHSVVRNSGMFTIYEEKMQKIDIQSIKIVTESASTIRFKDKHSEYSFNFSKSTLMKKFSESHPLYSFDVHILDDPLSILMEKLKSAGINKVVKISSIILPLYSTKKSSYGMVPEKSGINQWNAGGRHRNLKEVYIPIPAKIRELFPDFLPKRKVAFNIILPNKKEIPVVVAQADGKALMSNPNSLLGDWLVDEVFKIPPGKIVTRDILNSKGIDSVEISKINDSYYLNFKSIGSYDEFILSNS